MVKFPYRFFTLLFATLTAIAGATSETVLLMHSVTSLTRSIPLLICFSLLFLACISTFFYEARHKRNLKRTEHMLQFERRMYRAALMTDCDYAYTVNVTQNKIHALNQIGYLKDYGFSADVPFDTAIAAVMERMHPVKLIGKNELYFTEDFKAAYDEGKRMLDAVYHIPEADLYKKKTVFLSKDKDTETIYAFVAAHDVSEEYRTSAKSKLALTALSKAAEEITAGNLDVEIDCSTEGDVGVLAQSFRHTVEHLKSYISNINALARTDGMTGMENRTAYLARIAELDLRLGKKQLSEFAVIMFDLNNLKHVNDEHGHTEGDKYIIAAAKLLKKSFPDAELFRFGGDEFVALQFATSPAELDALLLGFEENVDKRNKRHNVKMSIACGYALYDARRDTCFADVYNRADAAMYAQKRKLKASAKAMQQAQ